MATFVNAMDNAFANRALGENGMAQLTTSNDTRVDLFFNAVRSTPDERMRNLIDRVIAQIRSPSLGEEEKAELAADLLVTIFQMRATRGMGKGERHLAVVSLVYLHKVFPKTIESLMEELPHYGSWKDILEVSTCPEVHGDLRKVCLNLFGAQLQQDAAAVRECGDGKVPKVSLAGKWAPREGKAYDKKGKVVKELCAVLFPSKDLSKSERRKLYRKLVGGLTRELKVPEVLMSAQRWGEINFKEVPSLCLARHGKAFLNEDLKEQLGKDQFLTGNRYPENADRVTCRKNLVEKLKTGAVNGKQLFPHEIVKKLYAGRTSEMEALVCQAQWDSIRGDLLKAMEELRASEDKDGKVDLGNLVPLVDVSGSMSGTPMDVAIALGILVSEISADCIKNRVITFESRPKWFGLDPNDSIAEKVKKLKSAPWGTSTNFTLALEMIYNVVKSNKLSMDEVPDLIVFSDMQFDQADRSFATQYEQVQRAFHNLGMEISGKPYEPPRIIFWNLRGNSYCGPHAPVTAETQNVQLLSGFSPSLLKLVLAGEVQGEEEIVETVDESGNVLLTKQKRKITPYETYRKAIDDECFDRVRKRLKVSAEGVLAKYSFSKEVTESGEESKVP